MHDTYLAPTGWHHGGIDYPAGTEIAIATEPKPGAIFVPAEELEAAIAQGLLEQQGGEEPPEVWPETVAEPSPSESIAPIKDFSGVGFGS